MIHLTQLVTEREEEVRGICYEANLNVLAVELTPKHVIVTVSPDKRNPASIVIALYKAMHGLRIPYYSVTYANDPCKAPDEWWFGALP